MVERVKMLKESTMTKVDATTSLSTYMWIQLCYEGVIMGDGWAGLGFPVFMSVRVEESEGTSEWERLNSIYQAEFLLHTNMHSIYNQRCRPNL
jgi:hypothetical protein